MNFEICLGRLCSACTHYVTHYLIASANFNRNSNLIIFGLYINLYHPKKFLFLGGGRDGGGGGVAAGRGED